MISLSFLNLGLNLLRRKIRLRLLFPLSFYLKKHGLGFLWKIPLITCLDALPHIDGRPLFVMIDQIPSFPC